MAAAKAMNAATGDRRRCRRRPLLLLRQQLNQLRVAAASLLSARGWAAGKCVAGADNRGGTHKIIKNILLIFLIFELGDPKIYMSTPTCVALMSNE